MSATGNHKLYIGAAVALLVPLGWTLWCGPAIHPRASTAEFQRALAEWDAFWSIVAHAGAEALRPDSDDPSLRAAGDTVFMRYRHDWDDVTVTARQAMQIAAVSNDPATKLALLMPLTADPVPRVRVRAWLEIARVQVRAAEPEAARAAARAALAVPGIAPRLSADAHFILGYLAVGERHLDEAEQALQAAIAADPGFWDARSLLLTVLAEQLMRPEQSAARCLDRTRQLIAQLGALPALAHDRSQFRDLADRFAPLGSSTHPALGLLAGLGYLWAGDPERARTLLAAVEHARAVLPAACAAPIIAQARAWRTRLPP